jgi:hypothetical protein
MVGYPLFRSNFVIVKTIFNPGIKINSLIQVQSSVTAANGTWKVFIIQYELESKTPHGKWFQTMTAMPMMGGSTPLT